MGSEETRRGDVRLISATDANLEAAIGTGRALARLPRHWSALLTRSPSYAMGSLAAFWFFERLAGVL